MLAVVICTYNRPRKVVELVSMLLQQSQTPSEIIVVDSSDLPNNCLMDYKKVSYISSSHKNQPYQRYLGYLVSTSEYILFLDDDMEPISKDVISILYKTAITQKDSVGIAIHFEDKYSSSLSHIPSTVIPKSGKVMNFARKLTGYAIPEEGKMGLCGLRGKQPEGGGPTEWVSGGAFLAKKKFLFQEFNFQLFDLFERKMGMGEDAIIGFTLSMQGSLFYLPDLLFWHHDQKESSYSSDHYSFAKRVSYSRLYLSLEAARLRKASLVYAWCYYHWYTFWRIIGLVLSYTLRRSKPRGNNLRGYFEGWIWAFSFRFGKHQSRQIFWKKEAEKDLSIIGLEI